jgi:hypothetical protein
MMTDKATQFVGGDQFSNYSREWLEKSYGVELTNRQWEILVDYCSGSFSEDEYQSDLLYAIRNIDRLEADYLEYDEALKKAGNWKPEAWNGGSND